MTFFKAESLAIHFGGIRAVDGVSFEIEPGQIFSIIGPNGARLSAVRRSGKPDMAADDPTRLHRSSAVGVPLNPPALSELSSGRKGQLRSSDAKTASCDAILMDCSGPQLPVTFYSFAIHFSPSLCCERDGAVSILIDLEVVMSVSTLAEKLYSEDKAARMLAIRSLGQIGAGAATAIPDLVELVDDLDKDVASLSLRALAAIGPDKSLKTKLVGRLRDPCPRMRQMVAFVIGAMGEDARDVAPLLASMLKDHDRGVQMHAMLALSRVAAYNTSGPDPA